MMLVWKVYYHDHTFTNLDGDWHDAPPRGVQAVAIPHDTGNRQIQTNDFYWWPDWTTYPIAGDVWGVMDWLLTVGILHPDQPITELTPGQLFRAGVKLGRSLDNHTYRRVYQQIVDDADLLEWGPKTTRLPNER